MKDLLIQILLRAGIPLLAVSAIFYGNEWADNFVTFMTIVLFIVSILVVGIDAKNNAKNIDKAIALPIFTWHLHCVAMIALTVYAGWFWLATVWCFNWFLGTIIKDKKANARKEATAT